MASLRESLTYEPKELGFGTSGLRDLVTTMTDLECYINAAGFLKYLADSGQIKPGEVVYLAGDLRESTPRIMRAMAQAITDGGYRYENCGLVPTPTMSYRSFGRGAGFMVTGSHIPADRNGIKFTKPGGEVLKPDEQPIHMAVAAVRARLYTQELDNSLFDTNGMLKAAPELSGVDNTAAADYLRRYLDAFPNKPLVGKKVVFYQHSAVGRDLLAELFEGLGAKVVPVGWSDKFIPIDSENVKPEHYAYFKQQAEEHPDMFALISTDGDSDRPFVVDEHGVFHRGDELGAVVAHWLKADFAGYPVSTSDAVDTWLAQNGVGLAHTKIGSPYVIAAMNKAEASGKRRVTGWEVNGGFLTGSDLQINGQVLKALPTRDAALPMMAALMAAAERGLAVSALFDELPKRYTQQGLIDNFPPEIYHAIVKRYAHDTPEAYTALGVYFKPEQGFGEITQINDLDGVRMYFANGDIAHIRESSNAPQLRIYSVADSQARADEIAQLALAEPDGIFRTIQRDIEAA